MKHIRKVSKKSIVLLTLVVAGTMIASAGLMQFFSAQSHNMKSKPLITLDGFSDGIIHADTLTDVYGGDVITKNHVLANVGNKAVNVGATITLTENGTTFPGDGTQGVLVEYYIPSATPLNCGAQGTYTLTRTINGDSVVWSLDVGAGDKDAVLNLTILSSTNVQMYKITTGSGGSAGSWYLSNWTGSAWGTPTTHARGVTEFAGITVSINNANPLVFTVKKAVMNDHFYWGYKAIGYYTYPAGWTGGTANTHNDGNVPLVFPQNMAQATSISFVIRYTFDLYIQPARVYNSTIKIIKGA